MTETKRDGSKIIAAAITDLVEQSGLSVEEVAEKANISRQYLYAMMKAQPNVTLDRVEAVFQACGADFADWLGEYSIYGKEKRLHSWLHYIIKNGSSRVVIAAKTAIEGWFLILCKERGETHREALKKDA